MLLLAAIALVVHGHLVVKVCHYLEDDGLVLNDRNEPGLAAENTTSMECHHRYLRWLNPTLEKFPRSQKFLLGDQIQTLGLDILESLVDATFSRERTQKLQNANIAIEKTRHLLRLCCDLEYLDRRRHEHAIRLLHDTCWPQAQGSTRF